MAETHFTPGPWHVTKKHPRQVCNSTGFKVAKCLTVTKGAFSLVISEDEAKANAHLIAAAPDLYAALEAVLDDLNIGAHPHLHIEQIQAALAKARGETND